MAVVISGIKSKTEIYDDFEDINDSSLSLCKRTRCARLKSGNASYWSGKIKNHTDLQYTMLVFFTWATPNTLISIFDEVVEALKLLNRAETIVLTNGLKSTIRTVFTSQQVKKMKDYLSKIDGLDELKYIISLRFSEEARRRYIYQNIIQISDIFVEDIYEIKLEYLVDSYINDFHNEQLLSDIKKFYSLYSNFKIDDYAFHTFYRGAVKPIPLTIAHEIMKESKAYPRIIASIAERSCRIFANDSTVAVGQTANEEQWFE